ncbi:MAG: DUF302 domain-containing protein [Paracoccaceae bacterium]|nr:DUF302 domain-containing protein [Paracoccaceae bacterium]MDE3123214.1 DUF302 domain-containing protein [Paracoccaceae bacterium]
MKALPLAAALAALSLAALAARAAPPATVTVQDSFDNVTFAVQNAITNAGLVVDTVSHTGEMLERTRKDVGGKRQLFLHADIFSFCSAVVSRAVMEADPMNIQYCPYRIFVAELPDKPGQIIVGHEVYPPGAMDRVNKLLDGIIKDATAF